VAGVRDIKVEQIAKSREISYSAQEESWRLKDSLSFHSWPFSNMGIFMSTLVPTELRCLFFWWYCGLNSIP
jgi:hypothetical protein